jgi:crossover junction endodeoxyribonuclease RuvC
MLQRYLKIPKENMLPQLDATDGLAAALCHFFQSNAPQSRSHYTDWKDFIRKNEKRVRQDE